jgi:hypothetical protein
MSEKEKFLQALNQGIDWLSDQLGLSTRDIDLLNVVGNAIGTAYDRGNADFTWNEFIAENWSAAPGDKNGDPRTWHDFWDGEDD